jgi:hypothetical protein
VEKRLQNRKRCLACEHYGTNVCPLLANADVFAIDKCIFEYDDVKNIQPNSIEEFIFHNYPIIFLQWNGKGKTLEVGDKVITLRGGFGTFNSGKFLTVTKIDKYQYWFTDGNKSYCVQKDKWYMSVFKLII